MRGSSRKRRKRGRGRGGGGEERRKVKRVKKEERGVVCGVEEREGESINIMVSVPDVPGNQGDCSSTSSEQLACLLPTPLIWQSVDHRMESPHHLKIKRYHNNHPCQILQLFTEPLQAGVGIE